MMDSAKSFLRGVMDVALVIIPLSVVLGIIFGPSVPFIGTAVVDNITGLVSSLGGSGLTGFRLAGREYIALRGYEDNSINTAGGDALITKYKVELRYPISLNPSATVYALAFGEAGNSWGSFEDYNPFEVKKSAGVGVRLFLPMFGLMGLDYGWGLDEILGNPDANGGQFHFSIGQNF